MSSHAQTLRSGVPQIGRQHACWPGTAAGEPPGVPEAAAAVGRAAQEAGPAGAPQGWRAGDTGPARRGETLPCLLTFQGRGVGFRQVWRQHGLCMDHIERRGAPQSPLPIVGRRESARPIAVFASAEDDFCRQSFKRRKGRLLRRRVGCGNRGVGGPGWFCRQRGKGRSCRALLSLAASAGFVQRALSSANGPRAGIAVSGTAWPQSVGATLVSDDIDGCVYGRYGTGTCDGPHQRRTVTCNRQFLV